MSDIAVRALTERDWLEVETIYREGIVAGNATFQSEPPSWADFDQGKLQVGRLVATDPAGSVLGWVAASRVSGREVYRGVVEHSVYVADRAHGRGVGTALLTSFLRAADAADIWTVQASIFPENTASLALHERAGFRRIGYRERIAYMTYGPWSGKWRDTVLVERRHP
ncbi:GNAT family N-acetyltransferase [Microbacterium sp. Yaish 1]|uniref:GNAT family N-acetyltransferase n=1 Tax=Microbacterium sp. Yaish 1 TaxID=2025014 RepID=UPI000B941FEA|nr:GNAT family N-acetyltransferase [Microbacterium sp. Yaish 1]OYC98201.1 N-acetyltransferase [Microbacterium sp. Yaish 1]